MCDRDLEAVLVALEAVSQDKKTNKTTAKVVDKDQWENPIE